jgi:hypothetical protein
MQADCPIPLETEGIAPVTLADMGFPRSAPPAGFADRCA